MNGIDGLDFDTLCGVAWLLVLVALGYVIGLIDGMRRRP